MSLRWTSWWHTRWPVLPILGLALGGAWLPRAAKTMPQTAKFPALSAGVREPLVFDGVTVIDVQHGRRIPNQRVVIVGTHIRAVGSIASVRIPTEAQVVDARGKYLIPGLWDMHTHSQRDIDVLYPLFIANGITGIRDAWSVVSLDTLNLWRRKILAGVRIGPPRQLLAGPAIDEVQPCVRAGGQGHTCVAFGDAADARHVVDSLQIAGADFIKTYSLRNRTTYFAIATEARRIGIPFGGHLGIEGELGVTASQASDSGATILDHVNSSGDLPDRCLTQAATVEFCQVLAKRFQRNGTWWVPTLVRDEPLVGLNGTRVGHVELGRLLFGQQSRTILEYFVNWFSWEFWAGSVTNLAALRDSAPAGRRSTSATPEGTLYLAHRVGLPIMAGTDAEPSIMLRQVPGFSLHIELALLEAEGLTPLEALQAATLNPAKYIHGTDSLGTVAPGKLADLVLLDADPLTDIMNTTTIRAVVANGQYFDRAALDRLLASARARAKAEPQP